MSLSCAVPGRGTQRDPILERTAVENPTSSGGSGQPWLRGHRAAWVTAPQAGRETLGSNFTLLIFIRDTLPKPIMASFAS